MTPKVVYTLNGVEKTVLLLPSDFTLMSQRWEKDYVEYKNPFTGDMKRKNRGYYYTATIQYEGVFYDLMNTTYRDLFNVKISDMKFFPNIDSQEHYDVDTNDTLEHDDNDVAMAYENFQLVFTSKKRYESPLNYPVGYWGARRTTFTDIGSTTFDSYI